MSAWPWPSSDSTAEIIPAFLAALQGMESATKGKDADLSSAEKKGAKYKYADLTAVMDVAKPTLQAHELAVTQVASDAGVQTIIVHNSGEWLSFPPLTVRTAGNTPQAQGSAITYGKRYQLLGILGIATEDDDGKAAAAPAVAPREPQKSAARREAEKLFDELKALDADDKAAMLAWKGERKVSVDELEGDADWREHVRSWLDERKATK